MNPDDLMMFLQNAAGSTGSTQVQPIGAPNASGNQMQPINAPPSGVAFNSPQPPPVPQSQDLTALAQPTGGQVPQLGAPQAPQQQQQRISGVKAYLSNFLYGVGEAMKAHAGLETDVQRQQREYNNDLNQRKFSLEQANTQAAITQHLAAVQQTQLQNQLVQNRLNAIKQMSTGGAGNDAFAQLGQLSPEEQALKSSAYNEAVMKGDMEPIFNAVKSIAQQRAIFGRTTRGEVTVTPDMADQHPELKPFIGKLVSVSNVASLKRSEAPFAPTVSNTTQTIELSDGTIVQVPKTTTTQKVSPGGTVPSGTPTPATPGATPPKPVNLLNRGGARTLVDANGNPLRGKSSTQMMVGTDAQGRQIAGTPQEMTTAGATNFTKLDSGEAAKVNTARQMTSPGGLFDLINKDFAQFKPGELEGLAPRWNEFLAGTYGTADPRYVALRTHLTGLLSTALMQAHVGARGGERIMEHFQDLANAGKMSLPTMKAAVEAERQYVEEKAMRPGTFAPNTQTGVTADDLLKKYPPKR